MPRPRKPSKSPEGRYSVTACGIEKSTPYMGAAISYAQGVASRLHDEPITLYVRDLQGTVVARIERTKDGHVLTYSGRSL